MSGNQELLASIEMFNRSMKEYAVGQVLSGAQEHISQLQAQNLKDTERQAAMQDFSNQLALQLGAASGGNAALVEGIASRFGLSAPQQASQAMQEKELNQNAQLRREALNAELMGRSISLQQQNNKQLAKEQQQIQVQRRLYQTQFNQRAAKSLEAADKAQTAVKMLQSASSVGDAAVRNFLARASGEVGALTEADKEPFGGNSSLNNKIKRWSSLQATGRLPESDRKELMSLATLLANKANADVESHARLVSEQMSGNLGIPSDEAYQLVYPKGGQRRGVEQTSGQSSDPFNEPGFSIIGD